jgi:hypothetical protein
MMRPETYDAPASPDGMIRIWLDRKFVDRLGQMRSPGESYSDVILRMAKANSYGYCRAVLIRLVSCRLRTGPSI